MTDFFDCQSCGHTFDLNTAVTGDIAGELVTKECPSCGQVHAFPKNLVDGLLEYKEAPNIGEALVETEKLLAEVSNLDDESLIDEIEEYFGIYDFMLGTEDILTHFYMGNVLTPQDRKKLEGVYVLVQGTYNVHAD